MPINLDTLYVLDLCFNWLWGGQINHIGICIWSRFLLPPLRVSVRPPFLHLCPSKNELSPVPIHQNKSPNTGFVLSILLVNNPLISPRLWNYMLDRYAIGNFRVAVLITPMKQSPFFNNYSASGTDAKYESAQMILSVLAHGITISFNSFVP